MQIYLQKLSNPSEEWSIDVEPSDTIEGVKQKLLDKESLSINDYPRIHVFFNETELSDENTLSDYNIQKFAHLTSSIDSSDCNPIFDKFAYLFEDGCIRFRRLRLLGYV